MLSDDGGIYPYLESGQLFPMGAFGGIEPQFTDAACAGPAMLFAPAGSAEFLSIFVGGTMRIVHRTVTGPSFAHMSPARVWKFGTTITTVPVAPPAVYELATSGACTPVAPADLPAAGDVKIDLPQIPAPPDGVGRLVIG